MKCRGRKTRQEGKRMCPPALQQSNHDAGREERGECREPAIDLSDPDDAQGRCRSHRLWQVCVKGGKAADMMAGSMK